MNIGDVLAKWRWAQKLTVRQAAKVIGIPSATLYRVEAGKLMDGATLGRILSWMLAEVK